MTGQTIAHYGITDKLGEGGRSGVYRTCDTKTGGDMALKVLAAQFERDLQRLTPFEQAARVFASLNHPSIASIHGLEESSQCPPTHNLQRGSRSLHVRVSNADHLADEAFRRRARRNTN